MKDNETKELTGNEIIAQFMEHDVPSEYLNGSPLNNTYATSWDWLMPVVEKINQLYNENFPKDFIQKVLRKEKNIIDEHYINVIALPMGTPIEEVYQNILEFIKWYNTQNKP